jgi:ABC-type transport system involved in multi-copper enzyme maturation permease subunit
VGSEGVAAEILSVPPLALFYSWTALAFTPALILMTAPRRISEEVSTGSLRLALVRTTRLRWCAGKFAGQFAIVLAAVLLSGVGAWCTGRLRMPEADGIELARYLIVYALKAGCYALPFVGLALGVSQLTRSPNQAVLFAFSGWVVLGQAAWISRRFAGGGWRRILRVTREIVPQAHRLDLWRLDWRHALPAATSLVALGLLYFALGYLRFRRRDT